MTTLGMHRLVACLLLCALVAFVPGRHACADDEGASVESVKSEDAPAAPDNDQAQVDKTVQPETTSQNTPPAAEEEQSQVLAHPQEKSFWNRLFWFLNSDDGTKKKSSDAAPAASGTDQAQVDKTVQPKTAGQSAPPTAETAQPQVPARIDGVPARPREKSVWSRLVSFFRSDDGAMKKNGEIAPTGSNEQKMIDLTWKNLTERLAVRFGQDYIIGPGDQLGITVWRDDMLTRTVLVLPDGKIQMPLVGEIAAGGKTVAELRNDLKEKFSNYIVDADIAVEVKQLNSLFIYIIGRVNAPGRQMLVADTTVLQALTIAGGLNPYASEDDIKIFRQDKEATLVYPFRYSEVFSGKHLEDNILLRRGDVIVVP